MRLPFILAATALAGGCGDNRPNAASGDAGNGSEVSIALPPALPYQAPERANAPPTAADQRTGPTRLVPSSPPIPQASLAGYIGGAGFECDEVTTVGRLENARGERSGIYKFDCQTGGSYQGTMRNNHLYFRRWTGIPEAD